MQGIVVKGRMRISKSPATALISTHAPHCARTGDQHGHRVSHVRLLHDSPDCWFTLSCCHIDCMAGGAGNLFSAQLSFSIVPERVWFLVGIFTKGSRTKRKSINTAPDYEYGDVWTIFCVPLVARRGVRKKFFFLTRWSSLQSSTSAKKKVSNPFHFPF